jgi:DNA topoisomerase VI subunit A
VQLTVQKTMTQRELYYMHAAYFSDAHESGAALARAQASLGVPRHALGILAAGRGWFAGMAHVQEMVGGGGGGDGGGGGGGAGGGPAAASSSSSTPSSAPTSVWASVAAGPARPIPADAVCERVPVRLSPSASFILVVEKECVFRRLVEDRVWERPATRCVLLTGCGFPDHATRAFLGQLVADSAAASPTRTPLPVYGLCDSNPFGLAILLTYRAAGAAPHLTWIGLHTRDVHDFGLPGAAAQVMTAVDEAKAAALARDPRVTADGVALSECDAWLSGREKMELEGIMGRGLAFLADVYLPAKVAHARAAAAAAESSSAAVAVAAAAASSSPWTGVEADDVW